jgi:hypothetical protein
VKRLMLDLETLSLGDRATVTAIGAVVFDLETVHYGELILPTVQPQIRMGRTVRWDTVVWWLEQEEAARKEVAVKDHDRVSVEKALQQLTRLYRDNEIVEVWGNGSNFDVSIMDTLYADYIQVPPWTYKQVRDLRTLASLVPKADTLMPAKDEGAGVKHSAIDDAYRQAIWAQRMLKELKHD